MESYSTDEQVIGTWVDGKKIYRKLVINNKNSSGEYSVDISSLNTENIILWGGTCLSNDGSSRMPFPHTDPWLYIYLNYTIANSTITLRSRASESSLTSLKSIYLWIEYTKTTD